MALTKQQKDSYRARASAAITTDEAAAIRKAAGWRGIRVTDPEQGYSVRNTLMLLDQWEELGHDPKSLTACAGFWDWQDRGRKVRKGEAGLFILSGGTGEREDKETGERTATKYFGGAYVWDISSTDPMTEEERAARSAEQAAQE